MVFRKYHCYGTSGISLFFETKKEDGSEVPSSVSLTIKSRIRISLIRSREDRGDAFYY